MPRDPFACGALLAAMLCGILIAAFLDPALGNAVMFVMTIATTAYLTRYWFGVRPDASRPGRRAASSGRARVDIGSGRRAGRGGL